MLGFDFGTLAFHGKSAVHFLTTGICVVQAERRRERYLASQRPWYY